MRSSAAAAFAAEDQRNCCQVGEASVAGGKSEIQHLEAGRSPAPVSADRAAERAQTGLKVVDGTEAWPVELAHAAR